MKIEIDPSKKYYSVVRFFYKKIRFSFFTGWIFTQFISRCVTYINIFQNRKKSKRLLDLGFDWRNPIDGFECLSNFYTPNADYILDASKPMPFRDDSFDLIYASHVLEHIPWYQVEETLTEWVRILKPGGQLEVWVPDGYKICDALLKFEDTGTDVSHLDGYYECVPDKDPRFWANLRIFAHGDGKGNLSDPNWHRTLFTKSLLKECFERVGLVNVKGLENAAVRGRDHGWINLGIAGMKV